MNEQHTKELIERGPILYQQRKLPMTRSLMCFGFECGDGWFWPLSRLTKKLEGLNAMFGKYGVSIQAVQVKEKYGTLRFYFDVRYEPCWIRRIFHCWNPPERTRAIIAMVDELAEEYVDQAEEECMHWCEECGHQFVDKMEDRVMTVGWISIICKECAEKNNRPYKPYGKADQ